MRVQKVEKIEGFFNPKALICWLKTFQHFSKRKKKMDSETLKTVGFKIRQLNPVLTFHIKKNRKKVFHFQN
jgi:hypothetical protein